MQDVIVIGGSFAGLAAALQVARARRSVLVLDTGEPRNRFAPHSHGLLGQDGKAPEEILGEARKQLLAYRSAEIRPQRAKTVEAGKDGFLVGTEEGELAGRRLILAYGIRDDLPDLPGLADCWGISVLHCPYCHAHEFGDRRLGIIMSTEHSVPAARMLQDWSSDVTLFTDGRTLDDTARRQLSGWKVSIIEEPLKALDHHDGQVHAAVLDSNRAIPLDAIFIHTRHAPTCDLALSLGCRMEEGALGPFVAVGAGQESSVDGVYAAGDLAWEMHNISWAIAHGASAGIAAHQSLID